VLTSLEIKNFRTFSHLFIEQLGRVNLILGKNNVGKTTLLEAVCLYASVRPAYTVKWILNKRNELTRSGEGKAVYLLHSLFHGREPAPGSTITVGESEAKGGKRAFQVTARMESERVPTSDAPATPTGSPIGQLALHIESAGGGYTLYADGMATGPVLSGTWNHPNVPPHPPFLSGVGAQEGEDLEDTVADRWDAISLTDAESRVLDALQLIAPIRGVSLVGDPRQGAGRMAKVRVEDIPEPLALATLGDGVVRMFELAVALEYAAVYAKQAAQGKFRSNVFPVVLVDEVEAGIHHTLHADLWRFVFRAARRLDVQVFATTHSWDCLRSFAEAVAEDDEADGLVVRLERDEDEVATRAIVIDRKKLPIIARDAIEVR